MRILFYPQVPHEPYVVYKIRSALNYQITNNTSDDFSFAIAWNDTTIWPADPVLEELARRARVINLACRDIRKSFVEEVFSEVFGYTTAIDPTIYQGNLVQKSEENAAHNGEIISCPITHLEEGFVYQRLIDNSVNDELVLDLRVPIFRGEIPFVYLKYREIEGRFGNKNRSVTVAETDEVFSQAEQRLIFDFCPKVGFDLGELDVLRDRGDQKIYIIDANNIPYGPPNQISPKDAELALAKMARTFEQVFLARGGRS